MIGVCIFVVWLFAAFVFGGAAGSALMLWRVQRLGRQLLRAAEVEIPKEQVQKPQKPDVEPKLLTFGEWCDALQIAPTFGNASVYGREMYERGAAARDCWVRR